MIAAAGKIYMRLLDALGWRLRRVFGDHYVDRLLVNLARLWRPLLTKPVFIGITGSAGKSTTKELLVGVLSYHGRGVANPGTLNMVAEVAKTILRAMPWHSFCISEVGAPEPNSMDEPLALLRPDIAIVTVVRNDHWSAYNSHEAIAEEKGKLVRFLPLSGVAILNADDDHVLGMAKNCKGKVITFGVSPAADLRAEGINATWPNRLRFTAIHGSDRAEVLTQLYGSHWVPAVLGAIGGGLATGMSLKDCAEGIATVSPFEGRMQAVTTSGGVTFVRDDYKAPLWTVDASLELMKSATAKRKIIVIGTLSDCGTSVERKYLSVAKRAQEVADVTVFVGTFASQAYKARKQGSEGRLVAFDHVRDAAEYINSVTQDGDLVMLKGTTKQDHLMRIILARSGDIACWRDDCKIDVFCSSCPNRMNPSGLAPRPVSLQTAPEVDAGNMLISGPSASNAQFIIGLGNPGAEFINTPHNLGYEVANSVAALLDLTWEAHPDAQLAWGTIGEQRVCLVKVNSNINETGTGLKQLAERLGFDAGQCILLHDALDMPIGALRSRMKGGAGGHRGIASILEAFQTDEFRRVKIGAGQITPVQNKGAYVITPFLDSDRDGVTKAVVAARDHVIEQSYARSAPKARTTTP